MKLPPGDLNPNFCPHTSQTLIFVDTCGVTIATLFLNHIIYNKS